MKLFNKRKVSDKSDNGFWEQSMEVQNIPSKYHYFFEMCSNKKVLHFGCTDWPIFKPETNLHIKLSKICCELHGFDIDTNGIEKLKSFVNQPYFSSFKQLLFEEYDVCLIPETIEHVDNIQIFLDQINKIRAKTFILTAPNCFSDIHINRNSFSGNTFTEIIHPDHNCWFSPFTLKNVIRKYTSLTVDRMLLLEDKTMVCSECSRKKTNE